MKRNRSVFAIACTVILLAACAGKDYGPATYSTDNLARLEEGSTTIDEAKELFGTPTSYRKVPDGSLLQWQVRKSGAVEGAGDSHLALLFDEDGRLLRIVKATRR